MDLGSEICSCHFFLPAHGAIVGKLEMDGCMFDLLEGDGNGFETWICFCGVGSGIGFGAVSARFYVDGWGLCFDIRAGPLESRDNLFIGLFPPRM